MHSVKQAAGAHRTVDALTAGNAPGVISYGSDVAGGTAGNWAARAAVRTTVPAATFFVANHAVGDPIGDAIASTQIQNHDSPAFQSAQKTYDERAQKNGTDREEANRNRNAAYWNVLRSGLWNGASDMYQGVVSDLGNAFAYIANPNAPTGYWEDVDFNHKITYPTYTAAKQNVWDTGAGAVDAVNRAFAFPGWAADKHKQYQNLMKEEGPKRWGALLATAAGVSNVPYLIEGWGRNASANAAVTQKNIARGFMNNVWNPIFNPSADELPPAQPVRDTAWETFKNLPPIHPMKLISDPIPALRGRIMQAVESSPVQWSVYPNNKDIYSRISDLWNKHITQTHTRPDLYRGNPYIGSQRDETSRSIDQRYRDMVYRTSMPIRNIMSLVDQIEYPRLREYAPALKEQLIAKLEQNTPRIIQNTPLFQAQLDYLKSMTPDQVRGFCDKVHGAVHGYLSENADRIFENFADTALMAAYAKSQLDPSGTYTQKAIDVIRPKAQTNAVPVRTRPIRRQLPRPATPVPRNPNYREGPFIQAFNSGQLTPDMMQDPRVQYALQDWMNAGYQHPVSYYINHYKNMQPAAIPQYVQNAPAMHAR